MEILTKINWVDVLILIIILRTTYVAFQDGLSHEIFPLVGSVFSIVIAFRYYQNIAFFIYDNLGNIPIDVLNTVSFIVLLVITGVIFRFVKVMLDKIIKVAWHPVIEKLGGLIAGAARASIVASTVLIIFSLMPLSYLQWSIRERSLTGMYFLRIGPKVYERASWLLPAVKIDSPEVKSDSLVKYLVSDKSVTKQNTLQQSPAKK